MKCRNNRGVIAEDGPAGACMVWEGGTVAGMFFRINASWAGVNKPAGAVMFWTEVPPTEGGGFAMVEGDPGTGSGADRGEGQVCREPLSVVIGVGFIWSLGISRSDLEKRPC